MSFLESYSEAKTTASKFEGMISPLSIAIFQSLFAFHKANDVTGDLIEFGVFRGKSASVLLRNLNSGETAYLVDVVGCPDFARPDAISGQYEFIKGKGNTFSVSDAFAKSVPASFRLSHHDGSHRFNNVIAEMTFMETRLAPRGIVILDDFLNPAYMQVVAASFNYLATRSSGLEFLPYSNNKAYLCHKEDFDFYSRFIIEKLLSDINSAEFDCMLARSDNHPVYRAFSLYPKNRPGLPDFYGTDFLGDKYYRLG
ncbi:class I SAM-dependent methyltransferase [Puniceibacterium confluentis]|uniref:class I SAM-dependent methyltransferase n=1 Tax=Puniceibacterium confluentis TaxID=1958944 RepID=UPI0016486C15|nr:class I SAM-dependent methyltransferase [Puniceibacterium confluentis]